jgi:hypothetical protein
VARLHSPTWNYCEVGPLPQLTAADTANGREFGVPGARFSKLRLYKLTDRQATDTCSQPGTVFGLRSSLVVKVPIHIDAHVITNQELKPR